MPRRQVTYTIAELVVLTGGDPGGPARKRMRRLLDKAGVRWLSTDPRVVSLAELRRCLRDLSDSIREADIF